MNNHLNDEQLINYAYHTLTDTQRETMGLHLATCRDCRTRLSEQEALQRRIHYSVLDRRSGATPSAEMRFAAIAPKLKRSRRIAMFFTGSKQFLYGAATLAILVLLLVGALPRWSYSRNWGYRRTAALGLVFAGVLLLVFLGYIPRGF